MHTASANPNSSKVSIHYICRQHIIAKNPTLSSESTSPSSVQSGTKITMPQLSMLNWSQQTDNFFHMRATIPWIYSQKTTEGFSYKCCVTALNTQEWKLAKDVYIKQPVSLQLSHIIKFNYFNPRLLQTALYYNGKERKQLHNNSHRHFVLANLEHITMFAMLFRVPN